MTKFVDNIVPAALMGVAVSFLGIGALIRNVGDVAWLLTNQAQVAMALILASSSLLAGSYLGMKAKSEFVNNGIELGFLIAFVELTLIFPLFQSFIGNWSLSVVNAFGGLAILDVVAAFAGALLGMLPGYFVRERVYKHLPEGMFGQKSKVDS